MQWCYKNEDEKCKWFDPDTDYCDYMKCKINPRTDSSNDYEGNCYYNK